MNKIMSVSSLLVLCGTSATMFGSAQRRPSRQAKKRAAQEALADKEFRTQMIAVLNFVQGLRIVRSQFQKDVPLVGQLLDKADSQIAACTDASVSTQLESAREAAKTARLALQDCTAKNEALERVLKARGIMEKDCFGKCTELADQAMRTVQSVPTTASDSTTPVQKAKIIQIKFDGFTKKNTPCIGDLARLMSKELMQQVEQMHVGLKDLMEKKKVALVRCREFKGAAEQATVHKSEQQVLVSQDSAANTEDQSGQTHSITTATEPEQPKRNPKPPLQTQKPEETATTTTVLKENVRDAKNTDVAISVEEIRVVAGTVTQNVAVQLSPEPEKRAALLLPVPVRRNIPAVTEHEKKPAPSWWARSVAGKIVHKLAQISHMPQVVSYVCAGTRVLFSPLSRHLTTQKPVQHAPVPEKRTMRYERDIRCDA